MRYKLGFVANDKRLNVAISRARSLLVVLGNAELLQADAAWRQLMSAIHKRGGYRGPKLDFLAPTPSELPLPSWASLLDARSGGNAEGGEHDFEGECHDLPWRNDY